MNFDGPVYYKIKKSIITLKAYIALFTRASTLALQLCLPKNSREHLRNLFPEKECSQTIVSDNGKIFVTAGKWLSKFMKDQRLAHYMGVLETIW